MQGIMRSFTSCQATDMDRLIWFSLLLQYLPVTESTEKPSSCISQPNVVIWHKIGQSAVLSCKVSPHCSAPGWHYEWFYFNENIHLRLKLLDNPVKYTLYGASLHINSLHANDSGIYHCAAVSNGAPARGMQHVGLGTTLVVREKIKIMVRNILLWVSFALLAIYSLVIVTVIIKKYGCNKSVCRGTPKTDRRDSAKKTQFRDVLQEMYSRRNMGKSKHSVSRNSSPVEASSNSADDIYQNV